MEAVQAISGLSNVPLCERPMRARIDEVEIKGECEDPGNGTCEEIKELGELEGFSEFVRYEGSWNRPRNRLEVLLWGGSTG